MEKRLTFDGLFCDIAMCQEVPCKYPDTGCSQRQVWERLKEYENTGLSPEDVRSHLWISIKDDKPEGECIAVDKYGEIMVGNIWFDTTNEHYVCESDGICVCPVTHWMPRPELPNENNIKK